MFFIASAIGFFATILGKGGLVACLWWFIDESECPKELIK